MITFRNSWINLAVVPAWVVAVSAGHAETLTNPFAPIVARNIFLLNPAASPAPAIAGQSLPTITPNGIISIFGRAQVLFKVTSHPPDQPADEKSYLLGEGQPQDGISVIRIDAQKAVITFDNHGTILELPLVTTASSSVDPAGAETGGRTGLSPKRHITRGLALAPAYLGSDQDDHAASLTGSNPGLAGGGGKNQGFMVPNVGFANEPDANHSSVQDLSVSQGVDSGNGQYSKPVTDVFAAERLADEQMVAFARQHMQ